MSVGFFILLNLQTKFVFIAFQLLTSGAVSLQSMVLINWNIYIVFFGKDNYYELISKGRIANAPTR
jgi:hypothetical protein